MDYEELKKDCIDYLKEGSNELEPKDVENIKKFVCSFKDDIVNIGLHFFLKDVRPMLPPVMNHSIAVA